MVGLVSPLGWIHYSPYLCSLNILPGDTYPMCPAKEVVCKRLKCLRWQIAQQLWPLLLLPYATGSLFQILCALSGEHVPVSASLTPSSVLLNTGLSESLWEPARELNVPHHQRHDQLNTRNLYIPCFFEMFMMSYAILTDISEMARK